MIPFFANTTFSIRTYIKHITVGYAGLILRDVKISLDVVYHITINTKVNYNFDIIIPWIYILMYVVHKQRDIPADSMLLSLSFDIGCCLLCCMVVWFSDCLSSLPPYPTKHRCTMNNNNICDHPPTHILHSLKIFCEKGRFVFMSIIYHWHDISIQCTYISLTRIQNSWFHPTILHSCLVSSCIEQTEHFHLLPPNISIQRWYWFAPMCRSFYPFLAW